ncbi:MAG: tRNA epoxyqueuosine(34) reductase QueG [Planctomycetaceae bacterium]|nr:tRNA epoxyqueuosine(34) reductase QueG [Planctomycetaceae bacterium]MDP7278158.1 tRNA epoxyqueuosine(34) reductase QueG [Planctomycetaceae bacterium]
MTRSADSDRSTVSQQIRDEARRIGFESVGIAAAGRPQSLDHFLDWLRSGYDGTMGYLSRRRQAYQHPRGVLPTAASLVMLGMTYRAADEPAIGPLSATRADGTRLAVPARVSRYASGPGDYHDLLRERLSSLADFVHDRLPGCQTRGIVDTAPLLERDFARQAGLGWFGKNTMLLSRQHGSWFFLAALLVDQPLDADTPRTDHCGTCTACLDACPTDAFTQPYVLDARRCISYLTIELRGEVIPPSLRQPMGDWLFGCDICQEVCPWNRQAPPTTEATFSPSDDLAPADAIDLLGLDAETHQRRFGSTPLQRPGRTGLVRNAAIVTGNAGNADAIQPLVDLLVDPDPVIRATAAWALGRIGKDDAVVALQHRLSVENNSEVRNEIDAALEAALPGRVC